MSDIIRSSISLVMYGIHKCSGSCLYCSAASTMNYNEDGNKNTFKFDKEKTKKRILEYTKVQEIINRGDSVELSIDIWGGNPLENFNEFKQVVEFCKNELKEFYKVTFHTSGNGLELRDDEKVKYLIDNDIHYQLSHDGLGQYIRTGIIDPLYWDKTKDNIIQLARIGILDWVNTTLTARNYSLFDNIEFWNKWRKEAGILDKPFYIKLNHIYPGTPPITKKWLFNDFNPFPQYKSVKPIKKGEIIGDLNFKGIELQNYMHEYRKLGNLFMIEGIENSQEYGPYFGYIKEQLNRWGTVNEGEEYEKFGSCRAFQTGLRKDNFAIDTLGEYCQCNLVDSSTKVKKPEGIRPKKCETCEYTRQLECFPCGSEVMDEDCEYCYAWCQVLEEFAQLKVSIKSLIEMNNQSEKEQYPIFCVKNYKI